MRTVAYVSRQAVGRVTPGLREAGLIEYIGNYPAIAQVVVQAMLEAGFVVREVTQPSGSADALVLGHGLAGTYSDSHTGALAALSAQAGQLATKGGTVILLQDTGGRFQPADERAWRGGLAGLARTATQEFPLATIRLIDVDFAGLGTRPAADRLVEELLSGGNAACVGLNAKGRLVPDEHPAFFPPNQTAQLTSSDTLLVTGGARGVTADCIIELAARTKAGFILLGRSEITPWPQGLPQTNDEKELRGLLARQASAEGRKVKPADLNRDARALLSGAEIRATLSAIEQAGGRALYLPTDVADPAALKSAVDQATQLFGPITGLVHGAGVLADKLIAEKTSEQVARVFAPKIDGLAALLSVLDTSTLKTIAFFSSVSARYGNAGQADYAMANEILNRMACWLKASHPQAGVTSINWGPWDGGMVDDGLRAKFAEMGVPLIPRDAGARIFADAVMAGSKCPVELIVGAGIAHD
ncbi:SDR family NAD(P)-dependent oxidoreductase [Henriciella litoralis]|uniref:SDR family NAD(P)-dependent oxidoreductase n=1 Tax=Henriciella litoralis TaxID=568102 RepID=UPI000A03A7B0|nr:SDR family NAD(P)-dependent oxidoreductase [Henriciella litoralis]